MHFILGEVIVNPQRDPEADAPTEEAGKDQPFPPMLSQPGFRLWDVRLGSNLGLGLGLGLRHLVFEVCSFEGLERREKKG